MMTRGAHANHVYLEVVGDGDPHSVIHPTLVRPLTPTDILESMLARDDTQRSATSLLREQADPATRLGEASQRYLDSLYVAAEDLLRHDHVGQDANGALSTWSTPWTTRSRRCPRTLGGGRLADLACPSAAARRGRREPCRRAPGRCRRPGAGERARPCGGPRLAPGRLRLRNAGSGPLPWMPAVPARLAEDPHWAPTSPSARTGRAARRPGPHAGDRPGRTAGWAQNGLRPEGRHGRRRRGLAGRHAGPGRRPATRPVHRSCRRPPRPGSGGSNRAVTGDHTPALKEWRQLLYSLAPQVRDDEFTPLLAERLAAMSRAGVTAHELLRTASAADHPAGRCPTSTPLRPCGGAWPVSSPGRCLPDRRRLPR